jgi:hypothetical protein
VGRPRLLVGAMAVLAGTGALALTGVGEARPALGGLGSSALRTLAPQGEKGLGGRVTVFRDPSALPPGTVISAAAGAMRPITVKVRAWLYWEDFGHGFLFPHPSLILLQDARSGRALSKRTLTSYPLVGGVPAPFVRSAAAYLNASGAVYDRHPLTDLLGFLRQPRASAAANPDLSGDGLVTIGQRDDPALTYDFTRVGELAKELKLEHAPAEPNEEGLVAAITKLKDAGKHDILIFLGGHGIAPIGKGHSYTDKQGNVSHEPESAIPQVTLQQQANSALTLSPGGIKRVLGKFPTLKFKLVIDSCYSGRFQEPLKGVPNLLITLTSTDADNFSVVGYGAAVFIALKDWANAAGAGDIAAGLRKAAASEAVKHWASYFPQFLHPQVSAPPAPPPPPPPPPPPAPTEPKLMPLSAVFMAAQSQTTYTEVATDPDGRPLTYLWSFIELNDPTCNKFNAGVPAANQAVWHHAASDGCNHELEGPNGHQGEITVLVLDGKFKCKATYAGSNTGTGLPPSPCTKVGS